MVFKNGKSLVGRLLAIWALFAGMSSAVAPQPVFAASGDITRISVSSNGTQGNQTSGSTSISADGRYIAFNSFASNLVAGDTNGQGDVFFHDRQTGATKRVSVSSSGTQGNNYSRDPVISDNGQFVAFWSTATNLVTGDTNSVSDIFLHDTQTGTTARISVNSNGVQANGYSGYLSISADGRYVAFISGASNLVIGDTNGKSDIFVHDNQSGLTTRVSISSDGIEGNGDSDNPFISADGRFVSFHSASTNLVINDTNAKLDVFVHDRQTGVTTRISVDSSGTQGNNDSFVPSLSTDGRYVAFGSAATNLVSQDTNAKIDIFVHDRDTGNTTLVSRDSIGLQTNASSYNPIISANGRFIAFNSAATNLVSGDTNGQGDVFLHDRQTGKMTRVSVTSTGIQASGGSSDAPSLSADGRFVAFDSSATNLVAGDTNAAIDAFVRENDITIPSNLRIVTKTTDTNDGVCNEDCSLREAITSASAGDSIVFNTLLSGQTIALASNLIIDKDLFIDGSELSPQITISGGNIAHLEISHSTLLPAVTISDVVIANGYNPADGGAISSTANLTLINSTLRNNRTDGDGGAIHATALTLRNTTIYQNQAFQSGGAIAILGNSNSTVVNSTITQNQAGVYGGAIFLQGLPYLEVFNGTVAENSASSGTELALMGSGSLILSNTIMVCTPGDNGCIVQNGSFSFSSGNSIIGTGPLSDFGLSELAANGGPTQTMALLSGSPLLEAGDDSVCANPPINYLDQRGVSRPQGNHCDLGAYEYEYQLGIHYVKWDASGANNGTAWAHAFTDLQAALAAASSGDEIWVAAGTYKPTAGTDRSLSFTLKNGVAIYGGFLGTETLQTQRDPASNVTILSGDIGGVGDKNDNSLHVVRGSSTNSTAVLDGFTVTAGNANGTFPDNRGGGMYNSLGSPTVTNVIFSENSAGDGGGGGMTNSSSSSPVLTNVTFSGNAADNYGGGMLNVLSSPALTNVTFIGNTSALYGGGMHNTSGSHPTLTDVAFSENTAGGPGGGMYNNNSNPTLTNVTFSDNAASTGAGINNYYASPILNHVAFSRNAASGGGGMKNDFSSPTLTDVTFSENSASGGGGMQNLYSSPTLKDVSFSRNRATLSGGGMYNGEANPTLTNVTFSENSATHGGGMENQNNSHALLTNVTFSSNSATTSGGGMTNISNSNPTLTNVTFSGNSSNADGGGIYNSNSAPTLRNVILWDDMAPNGAEIYNFTSVPLISHSIVEGSGGSASWDTTLGTDNGNNLDANPLLGMLADNGGLTQTMALAAGSPAIGTGDNTNCPATDQRGVSRPQGSACDIGAYEYVAPPTPTATASPTDTPTHTLTPTASNTPTPSSTPILNCDAVYHGALTINGNGTSMSITNQTGIPLAVQDVFVVWDHDRGHLLGNDKTLRLQQASLNGVSFWNGDNAGPSAVITPLNLYIPPGDSTILFSFHQSYDRSDGSDEILINLATNGCQPYPIHAEYEPPTATPTPTNTFTPTVTPPYSYNPLYLSLTGSQTIGGVASADEDILRFDGQSWSLFFDGSDVGMGSPDLSAFSILDADTILMSFSANVTVNGISATPQDVLRFDATSLGSVTAGTFSMYLDGSDVSLADATNEKIDSLKLLPDGRLLLSTTGNPSVPGATTARDEDVLAFTPASLGDVTSGTWAMYFDGSDVGLSETSGEDIDALDVVGNTIYISAQDIFSVNGLSGEDDDVFVCAATSTGDTTACSYSSSLYFDGSTWGLTANDIDGFNFLTPGSVPTAVPTNTPTPTLTATLTRTPTVTSTIGPSPTFTPTFTPSRTPTSGAGTTVTFIAVADARVSQASPSTNYGTATTLQADGGSGTAQTSFITFNAGGMTGPILSAKLRVFCTTNGTANGPAAHLAYNNWHEYNAGGVTWDTQPPLLSGPFDNKGAIAANSWVEYDVTALMTTNGTYSFALVADSSDGVVFSSREGTMPPQLVVTFESGSSTSTPTATNPPSITNTPTQTPTAASPTPTFTATQTIVSPDTPTATQTAAASLLTFTPAADAYVDANNPATNYGALATLRVDASPVVRSYLRFDVQGVNGTMARATLRIFANSASSQGIAVNGLSDNTWTESTLNYNNAPALGNGLGSSGSFGAGAWISIDVTAYVTGNGTYNLALTTPSSTAVSLASRESGGNAPQLIIETIP